VQSLNPGKSKSSAPQFAILRHQLGIKSPSQASSATLDTVCGSKDGESEKCSLEECMGVLSELSEEIKGLAQAYQDKEKAS